MFLIKKHILQTLTGGPKNPFPDPISQFGAPGIHFGLSRQWGVLGCAVSECPCHRLSGILGWKPYGQTVHIQMARTRTILLQKSNILLQLTLFRGGAKMPVGIFFVKF